MPVGAGIPLQPFNFFTFPTPSSSPFQELANWDDDISQYQFPQGIFAYYYGLGMLHLTEYSMGDSIELPPALSTASDTILMGYKGYNISKSLMIQADDSVEKITLSIEAWDTDADQQNQQLGLVGTQTIQLTETSIGDNNELPIIPITAYDTDADQQIPQLGFIGIQMIQLVEASTGDNNELPIIPTMELDSDSDYQYLNSVSFSSDTLADENIEFITLSPIVLTSTWDDIAEQQKQLPEYYKDHLADESVEKITLPSQFFDADTEQQLLQSLWNLDQVEERNQVPIISIMEWDTDTDQQRLNPTGFNTDTLADECVELVTSLVVTADFTWDDLIHNQLQWVDNYKDHLSDQSVELIVLPASAYDTDADQQRLQDSYQLDKDVLDTSVEILPLLSTASDVILMGYIGYRIPKSLMLQADDCVERVIPIQAPLMSTWDDINEQSRLLPDYYKDHLTDEGTEKIFIPTVEIDNDAEQQRLSPLPFSSDTLSDEGVELITLPPVVPKMGIDADTENQIPQLPYQLDRDVVDSQVEILPKLFSAQDIILMGYRGYSIPRSLIAGEDDTTRRQVTLPTQFYDTDADQQFNQALYQIDTDLSDTGIEKIILPPGITSTLTWDNDADQQFLISIQVSDDITDSGVEFISLPPFIDIVEVTAEGEDEHDN